jgi:hypothetical protein
MFLLAGSIPSEGWMNKWVGPKINLEKEKLVGSFSNWSTVYREMDIGGWYSIRTGFYLE